VRQSPDNSQNNNAVHRGDGRIARKGVVTDPLALVTVFPLACWIVTVTAGVMELPAAVVEGWTPKTSFVAVPAIPFPLNVTVWGLPGTLSLKESVPVRCRIVVGEKITDAEQLFPALRVAPHVVTRPLEKSPVAPKLVKLIGTNPVLWKVTDWALLEEPSAWSVNVREVVESEAVGFTTVICTMLGVLELKPLLTMSWRTYVPATPATKLGVTVVLLLSIGNTPGAETNDQL